MNNDGPVLGSTAEGEKISPQPNKSQAGVAGGLREAKSNTSVSEKTSDVWTEPGGNPLGPLGPGVEAGRQAGAVT